jgi:hypothetical protein
MTEKAIFSRKVDVASLLYQSSWFDV